MLVEEKMARRQSRSASVQTEKQKFVETETSISEMTTLKLIDTIANNWYERTHDKWWLNLALMIERRFRPVEIKKKNHVRNKF